MIRSSGRLAHPGAWRLVVLLGVLGVWVGQPVGAYAADNPPARPGAPLTIEVVGNQIILTSDDPQALAVAQELCRALTAPSRESAFEVMRLKHAQAADAAQLLDELYNGTRPQSGWNPFGGPDESAPAAPRENRIRIVANPANNSLVVWGKPADRAGVRRLLETAIDAGGADSRAANRTWVLPPLKHANAAEVAQVLRALYGAQSFDASDTALAGGFDAFDGAEGFSGRSRTGNLSVGVYDRSNSLVLTCSEKVRDEIKEVVDRLDATAQKAQRVVKVVSLQGVDPQLVQKAVDAIQGRKTAAERPNSGNGTPGFDPSQLGPSGPVPADPGFRGYPTPLVPGVSPFPQVAPGSSPPGGTGPVPGR